jgi:hypothetical protein
MSRTNPESVPWGDPLQVKGQRLHGLALGVIMAMVIHLAMIKMRC